MLKTLKNIFFSLKKEKKSSGFSGNKDFNKKLVYSLSKSKIPTLRQFKYIGRYLSKGEARLMKLSFFLIFFSFVFLLVNFYITHLELRPVFGGEYTEGLVGTPKHINPLYSPINDVDNDLASLIYSSLYKRASNGSLQKDLVRDMEMSEDEKTYKFSLKEGVKWHDGQDLNADDVIFTIETISDSSYQSPLRSAFSGIEFEKSGDYSFTARLDQPYAAFRDLLTFGIMPAHLWEQLGPESFLLTDLNLKPIGSGPYKFSRFIKDNSAGRIISIELEANQDYYAKKPYVENIGFRFYPSFQEAINALNENIINGIAYLPKDLKNDVAAQNSLNFHNLSLTEILALNFNSKKNEFLGDKNVRKALAYGIDKDKIIDRVFGSSARRIDSPILPETFAYKSDIVKYNYKPEEALGLLSEADWSLATITPDALTDLEEDDIRLKIGSGKWLARENEDGEQEFLTITINTIDSEDNLAISEEFKNYWQDLGIRVFIQSNSPKEINSRVIRDREYEALLYSQSLSFDPDVYAFWHSSQAVSGGMNIANYINGESDRLLSEARTVFAQGSRQKLYFAFQDLVLDEVPAIFISSPNYLYIQEKDIKNFNVEGISEPSDRFADITDWYINTGRKIVW